MATTNDNHPPIQDTGHHDRRLAQRLQDPEFRAEFERQQAEIRVIDSIVQTLDQLREQQHLSKAELARLIDKHPASVRRLLTAPVNPELRTIVAMASALDAEVLIVPRGTSRQNKSAARASAAA